MSQHIDDHKQKEHFCFKSSCLNLILNTAWEKSASKRRIHFTGQLPIMNNYHITINSKRKPLYSTHSQKGPTGDVQFNITNMTTKQTRRSQRICQMYGELRQLCPTNTGIFTIQNNWGECEKLCWNCKGLIQKVRGHVLNITQQSTLGVTQAKTEKHTRQDSHSSYS